MNYKYLNFIPESYKSHFYNKFFNNINTHKKNKSSFLEAKLKYATDVSMYDLLIGDVISGNIAFNGFYELKLTKEISRLAKNGGTFLDIGANMGYFSLIWLANNTNNKVIALEASTRVNSMLEKNIMMNNFSTRATIHNCAAGKENGICQFDSGPIDQSGWGGISNTKTSETTELPLKRIDDMITHHIDVMKVDIEGSDTWALMGCEKLLREKKINVIFFEHNIPRMRALGIHPDESISFLKEMGYKIEVISGNPEKDFCEFKAYL